MVITINLIKYKYDFKINESNDWRKTDFGKI